MAILLLLYIYGVQRINNNQIIYSENELRIVHTYFDQKNKWNKESIDKTAEMGSFELITILDRAKQTVSTSGNSGIFVLFNLSLNQFKKYINLR